MAKAYNLKETVRLGTLIEDNCNQQYFPATLEELDQDLAEVQNVPKSCAECRREMADFALKHPEVLLI